MTERQGNVQHGSSRRRVLAGAGALAGAAILPAVARAAPSGEPITIGVIAELSTILGPSISGGAQMAADEINAKGGLLGRPIKLVVFDDHMSATDAVRAFQRLASQNKAVAILASFVGEIALALVPWGARLKMPWISPGASPNEIPEAVHRDYERNKYTFLGTSTSYYWGKAVADSAHDLLVNQLHMKTCVIMSENAAWTTPLDASYLEFLPQAGLKVLDHIRFSPDTTDFTPIFNKIEAKKPNVVITGISHVGVVPTVQWAEGHVPVAMYGFNNQADSSTFWKDTHGAAEGAVAWSVAGPASAITPKTVPFTEAYVKRFHGSPAYVGYSSYDMLYAVANAIAREKSTDADRLVTGLEATDFVGTMGQIKFYGRKDQFTHALEYGPGAVQGVFLQWQKEKIRTIWPTRVADAKVSYPPFVKLPA